MKKVLGLFSALTLFLANTSCVTQFDDSELRESINSLEQRISVLEKIQNAYKIN